MSGFRIVFDTAVAVAVDRAVGRADDRVTEMLQEIGERGTTIAQGLAPTNSGRYRESIGYELESSAVNVGSKSRRAHLVEHGRKPGRMPPPTLIASIFDVDKQEAFQIARWIGEVGTPGSSVMEFTRNAMEFEVDTIAARVAPDLSLDRMR
jgi:hypothetical protein